jgi:hypothetical protein
MADTDLNARAQVRFLPTGPGQVLQRNTPALGRMGSKQRGGAAVARGVSRLVSVIRLIRRGALYGSCALLASVITLTPSGAKAAFPGVDGLIVFARQADRARDLWVVRADGTELRRLTALKEASAFGPTWSPDGRRVAYFVGGPPARIFVVGSRGGKSVSLSSKSTVSDYMPAWSPDGSRLVFASSQPGKPRMTDLYVMHANGKNRRRLTRIGRPAVVDVPAWSPDGTKIVYELDGVLHLISSRGGRRGERLVTGQDPAWSPDGRRIVFTRKPRALVLHLDGRVVHSLPDDLTLDADGGPAWAPTGDALAVAVDLSLSEDPICPNSRVEIVDAQGTGRRKLLPPPCPGDREPDWQPVCTLYGTDGDDRLIGTSGNDVICGLGGNDRIAGLSGDDVIISGDGDDVIFGGPGTDRLFGSAGDEAFR